MCRCPKDATRRPLTEAVEAAEELGYPVVIKAQVQIGGRGKAGGIKLAADRAEAEEHAEAILGMDIRGFTVHEVWVEQASEIDEEYYAAIVFDRSAKQPMAMLSRMGGMDVEAVAEQDPEAMRMLHVDPLIGFQDFHGRRLAFEAGIAADVIRPVGAMLGKLYEVFVRRGRDAGRGQPAADHQGARGRGARRQGHDRRQRPLPAPRRRRAAATCRRRTRRSGWPRSAGSPT